jgi:hypothetical protein
LCRPPSENCTLPVSNDRKKLIKTEKQIDKPEEKKKNKGKKRKGNTRDEEYKDENIALYICHGPSIPSYFLLLFSNKKGEEEN